MSRLDEELTEQFYAWELRGRGWTVFDRPVALEPVFRPFRGHSIKREPEVDDGRRPTVLSSLWEGLFGRPGGPEESQGVTPDEEQEAEPEWRTPPPELVELQMALPVARSPQNASVESFIRHVSRPGESVALEILGTRDEVVSEFVVSRRSASRVENAIGACFPGIACTRADTAFHDSWNETGSSFAVAELGLGIEFAVPLAAPQGDLLASVVTALDDLGEDELGICQVLFEPTQNAWARGIVNAVTDGDGGPFFVNRPDLVRAAEVKASSPLYGVVVRLASSAAHMGRCWEIIADMAAGFAALSRAQSNHLIALSNDDYPPSHHEEDLLNRQSRRSGMILNLEELTHFLTLPLSVVSRRLRRDAGKSQPAPALARRDGSLLLGDNLHAGATAEVRLTPEHRVRHTHIIGASGTGKSTLLFNLIRQDVENGQGVAVLDPHGDLVDKVLAIIPEDRIDDVVLIDPSDEEHSVGFNILAAHSDFEQSLLASDLVSVFQRLSTSWGDQMNSVLRNAILAFLESTEGGTLAELRRFLLDAPFRNRFLATVTDPEIVYYWRKAFPQLSGNKSVGPVVTRLDEFLSRKPIRYMVSQKENRVNFAAVIDSGHILLAKLPQGLIGRENSYLLGSLLLSKLQQMAMSRQRMRESERRDFWCYVDEFHCFITPSMAEILTGARKYRLGLTLAHQELRQLQASDEVASAVLANAFTRVAFRVGDADARSLESGFSHFEARDLQNLEIGHAICRIERSDFDFNLTVRALEREDIDADERRDQVIAASRAKFSRSRSEIDAELLQRWREEEEPQTPKGKVLPQNAPASPPSVESPQTLPPNVGEEPPTSSEKKVERTIPSEPVNIPTASRELQDLGRGGAQHQAIQHRIKAEAEALGFRATVEKCVLDGQGSIDLALEKPGCAIACEINVTSTIDYEVGNVTKCLKAGFARVAVICPRADRLSRLAEAVRGCLAAEESAKIGFFSPEDFSQHLASLPLVEEPAAPTSTGPEKRTRGYKVKTTIVDVSPEEAKLREDAALKMITERLRREKS